MAARHLLLLIGCVLISACNTRYMGIDTQSLSPQAAAWVARAQAGDKQAQYELGLRFARGIDLPQDCAKARKLFRRAAAQSGGTIWIYSPPVTKGGSGRVIPIDNGPIRPGLLAAKNALEIEGLCQE